MTRQEGALISGGRRFIVLARIRITKTILYYSRKELCKQILESRAGLEFQGNVTSSRLLQFLPDAQNDPRYSGDGGGADRSRLDDCGTDCLDLGTII